MAPCLLLTEINMLLIGTIYEYFIRLHYNETFTLRIIILL